MSGYASSIVALKSEDGTNYLPFLIDIGDLIELRYEPQSPGAATAYHHGTKVGFLAKEKQAVWDALTRRPHRVVVVGKLTDECGDLVSLDVEISFIEQSNPLRGRAMAGMAAGLAALVLVVTAIAATQTLELRSKPAFGNRAASSTAVPGNNPKSKEMAAGRESTQRLSPLKDLFQDQATKETSSGEGERKLARIPSGVQSNYLSSQYLELAQGMAAQGELELRKRAADLALLQQQSDELQRMTQNLAAQRLVKSQSEVNQALNAINSREVLQHRQQLAAWDTRKLAAEKRAKAESARIFVLQGINDRELVQRRQQLASWKEEKAAAEKRAKAESARIFVLQGINDRELVQRRQQFASWEAQKLTAEKREANGGVLLEGATHIRLKAKAGGQNASVIQPSPRKRVATSKQKLGKKIIPPVPAIARNKSNFSRYAVQFPAQPDMFY